MNKYKIRKFVCISCGKEVEQRRAPDKTKYCSLECYRKSARPNNKTGKMIICKTCGKEVYKQKIHLKENNFCSTKCANLYQGKDKLHFTCKICGNKFVWSKSRIKQVNPKYCSTECCNNDKEHKINCGISSTIKQQKDNGLNKLELLGRKILQDIGIEFEEQVLMFNKFLVDVLIPSKNLIIQWDGEYWHTKPKRVLLDKSQDMYLKKCGYKVIRITDKQIKNEIREVYDNITTAIQ